MRIKSTKLVNIPEELIRVMLEFCDTKTSVAFFEASGILLEIQIKIEFDQIFDTDPKKMMEFLERIKEVTQTLDLGQNFDLLCASHGMIGNEFLALIDYIKVRSLSIHIITGEEYSLFHSNSHEFIYIEERDEPVVHIENFICPRVRFKKESKKTLKLIVKQDLESLSIDTYETTIILKSRIIDRLDLKDCESILITGEGFIVTMALYGIKPNLCISHAFIGSLESHDDEDHYEDPELTILMFCIQEKYTRFLEKSKLVYLVSDE